MKKLLAIGSLCLAMGMASCKTYCPAYNYAKLDNTAVQKAAPVNITASTAVTDKRNS